MNLNFTKSVWGICLLIVGILYFTLPSEKNETKQEYWSSGKTRVKAGADQYAKPDGFIEYFNSIAKHVNESESSYKKGYRMKELSNSRKNLSAARTANGAIDAEFISRGPGNVGGRTRAIAVDPEDATHCTWIAGAASGGIWKTTDCGESWTNISPDLPNLSTNSIAQSASNPDVIYVGTGEVFAGNSSFVRGDGIFKSVDRGASWSLLPSTVDNANYTSVNRIAVDPANSDILVIATNTGIFRSVDGGASWTETFTVPFSGAYVQDLQVDPADFNIQYAGVNSNGVYKSIDGGVSWSRSSAGIGDGIRFEIAVAPSNPNIVYTSSYVGETTILYFSDDKAENWVKVVDNDYNTDFLGAQGWYDNTVEVNPYNPYEVFVGGVSIGKFLVDPNNIGESDRQFLGVDQENTSFLAFVNFSAQYNGGSLNISDGNLSPSNNPVTVEIRWGGTNSQKAHRFTVPANGGTDGNGGAGIPATEYVYEDYIDVPFEVWDTENNRQLMVSFRDQENNGVYDLNPRDDANDPALLKAREYLYIHDITYSETTPSTDVTNTVGGVQYANMYYFWPILAANSTWDPASYSNAVMRINFGTQFQASATAVAVYDAYGNYEGQNQANLHPDHHHLTFIKTNEANEEFMIVNGNDGSFGLSMDNGARFVEREKGYVTSQFYGADKKPGENKYIGGTQDNGTWVSTGTTVDATNEYSFEIGGDGFEVLWHATNTNLVLGSIYNNAIRKSTNGGDSFSASTTGITAEDGPFITRLAGSTTSPDVVYAIGGAGVYKSTDFGSSWTMKNISGSGWGGNASASDVEVSLANDQIVWAGAGMARANVDLDIFVSEDAGETYSAVNLPADFVPNAYSTGIYTHPTDENTAYVLFSVADQAKILKTEDLGQTWTDISGFGASSPNSSNGFPDVYVHSLIVMPFDTNVIWAGTEIGIYESLDGGATWNVRPDFPAASVWSMKLVNDQIVIGTHGRGIWTATLAALAQANIKAVDFAYLGYGDATLSANLPVVYDSIKVKVGSEFIYSNNSPAEGAVDLSITGFNSFKGASVELIGYFNGDDFSSIINVDPIDVAPELYTVSSPSDATSAPYPVTITMENNEPFDKVEVRFNNELVYTDEQSVPRSASERVINFDYENQARNLSVKVSAFINGSVFESTFSELLITSNKSSLDNSLKVYPNPVVDMLRLDNTKDLQQIKIYDANGRLLFNRALENGTRTLDINFSGYKQGMYLVQVIDQKGAIKTQRVLKK